MTRHKYLYSTGYSDYHISPGTVFKCKGRDFWLESVSCTVNPDSDPPSFLITWRHRERTEGAVMRLLED